MYMINKLYLSFVGTLLLTACATDKPRITRSSEVPGRILPDTEAVRSAENVKAYPVGRYIDPNNPRIMHERHPVYRVESSAKWNLNPTKPAAVPTGPGVALIHPAKKQTLSRDELYLELYRQKEVTSSILSGTSSVSQQLDALGKQLQETQNTSFRNLQEEVNTTKKRLADLEENLRATQAVPAANNSH